MLNGFKGRRKLYDEWYKANVQFTPGSEKYKQYMEQVALNSVVLKAGGSMWVHSFSSIVGHSRINSVLPPGHFFEVYAVEDSVVATRYFYMFETLHLTELSRRYDALVVQPGTIEAHGTAYITLTRIMSNFPFRDVCQSLFSLYIIYNNAHKMKISYDL